MSAPSRNHKRRLRSPYLLPLFSAGLTVANGVPRLRRLPVASSRRLVGCGPAAARRSLRLLGCSPAAARRSLRLLGPALLARRLFGWRFDARHGAAGLLDRGPRALGHQHAVERDGLLELAVEDHLRLLRGRRDHARRLQREQVDVADRQAREIRQPHFGSVVARARNEAALGETALQRHLAAFEADLVEAARARVLTLVAASGGLAESRADAAADAAARLVAARG